MNLLYAFLTAHYPIWTLVPLAAALATLLMAVSMGAVYASMLWLGWWR